ncbi:MAG: hypothetical protein II921_05315 [Treponema sp.]|nr:hypothetical protein [Treponema sp.]
MLTDDELNNLSGGLGSGGCHIKKLRRKKNQEKINEIRRRWREQNAQENDI